MWLRSVAAQFEPEREFAGMIGMRRLCPFARRPVLVRPLLPALLTVLVAAHVLLPTSTASGQSAPARPASGKLRGVAYDSVRARPLARTTIQLIRESDASSVREITADSLGRFSADSLQPGRWIVGARHPWIDSLAVEQLAVPVDVKRRGTTRTTVAVPAGRSLVARVCGRVLCIFADVCGDLCDVPASLIPASNVQCAVGGVAAVTAEVHEPRGARRRRNSGLAHPQRSRRAGQDHRAH